MFLRKVAFSAQLFVNFYILKHLNSLPNELLKQKFCRHLVEVWVGLNSVEGVNLTVDKGVLNLNGQDIKIPVVKHIVYGHVLNVTFSPGLGAINADSISHFFEHFEKSKNLPQRKGKTYINSLYTDGRCSVDPNRKDAFLSFHGNTDVRRPSSTEYYNINGSTNRLKLEQDRKKGQGVQATETNIPSVKSKVSDEYITHVKYMMQNMDTLFNFYNFQTARRKRSKTTAKYLSNAPQASSRRGKIVSRNHKKKFEEGDKNGYKTSKMEHVRVNNMYTIATSIWRGDGRSDVFKKQSATTNVVATPHSGKEQAYK
ncbi:uncharacterized protein EV154DRAFT_485000 [Mucor mucedo]|uniref:uncharacterized protein n=1 Tax=Mucor mucedo TaxID=29922 RepID=UPI00221F6990|nr:uncharacterized protein EV154DRAFT_485000 [Mucor mucedo]KAI7887284.1 hypothetical protein EV154DRAFT_485000 [Mucor mucedo]